MTADKFRSKIKITKYKESKYWNKDWNKEILFWLNPPVHSLEQVENITLNRSQKKFSEPTQGHFRVRGVAGSGKTLVLAYRAAKLASEGHKVLVLSFNITLWHLIRDLIARVPVKFSWENITFNHFHGLCTDILNFYGKNWPVDENADDTLKEKIFIETVPNLVIDSLKTGREKYQKYDAILIDEGQDYYYEWYEMLKLLLTKRDEFVVVCDKDQNIYVRDMNWLDKRRKGVEKLSDWIELRIIYRLPEKIVELAERFLNYCGINQEVKVEHIIKSTELNFDMLMVWKNINDEDWLKEIDEAFEVFKNKFINLHPSDVVILLPTHEKGMECVAYFANNKKISSNYVFEEITDNYKKAHKRAFWMGDGRIKMSTIHSFKGWEAQFVILYIPENRILNKEKQDKLIYTAITRSKQNLFILNGNKDYFEFGEIIKKEL